MIEVEASPLLRQEHDWRVVLDRLQSIDARICMVVTGGGTGAISKCFGRPGRSRHLIEAVVPYSRRSAIEFLGRDLELPSVCEQTAVALADVARGRAERLSDDHQGRAIGLALTAALPTAPPRKQQHAIYVALSTNGESQTWFTEFAGDRYDRVTAEQIAEAMIWESIVHGV